MESQKRVELIGVLAHPEGYAWSPDDYPVAGAMGCFRKDSSSEIWEKYKMRGQEYRGKDWEEVKELIMRETSGRGHGAVLDLSVFLYSIENLTRASTLFLCGPEYASHLQQSLRRASAEKGFARVSDDFGNDIMKRQFDLYDRMVDAGISKEDARIILPLNTKTNITTFWSARELMHLNSLASRMSVTLDTKETVERMYELAKDKAPYLMKNRDKNYEVLAWRPAPLLFARSNSALERIANEEPGAQFLGFSKGVGLSEREIEYAVKERDEGLLSALKHYHFSFLIPMSLMAFHQATRQRTWHQAVEPLTNAVKRGRIVVPDSIGGSRFSEEYEGLALKSLEYVRRNIDNAESFGVVPHSLEVYDLIHIDGWNAIYSIGKRTCKTAQWEIRDKARFMAQKIRMVAPELGSFSLPQGMIYGYCPERENCGACKK